MFSVRYTYESHSKYGLMIKSLFMTGTRVAEFVHIQVKDLHLDADPPQIYIAHAKRDAKRYVPILPSLTQELRTHLQGVPTAGGQKTTLSQCGIGLSQRVVS
jgi:integrase/recombinase XerD